MAASGWCVVLLRSTSLRGAAAGEFKMQQVRFRLDSQANFLTEREALERLTHYLNFTGEPQEADCTVRQAEG